MPPAIAVGIDFGTTNSAIASATDRGVELVRFGGSPTFRSVLFFDAEERTARGRPLWAAGPDAIERYLAAEGEGRLILSPKSYLGSRLFQATDVYGFTYTLEALIALLVESLRRGAAATLGELPPRIVVGRPVKFAGVEDPEDEAYALARLRESMRQGGFADIEFEYEPVAAAYHYEATLKADELVLIADFGGGTSDFCLARVGPSVRRRERRHEDLLGTAGVPVAGDLFDSQIVRHLVAPALGKGGKYLSFGKLTPVPSSLFAQMERWHHLSFLKSRRTQQLLEAMVDGTEGEARARVRAFVHLVDADLGFHLYRAVERCKVELSQRERTTFTFGDGPIAIEREVTRADFEGWIAAEVASIAGCVDGLLAQTGVKAAEVDRVFMTGGTSLVPSVRREFAARFGEDRLRGGDELTSVASGLALRARDLARG